MMTDGEDPKEGRRLGANVILESEAGVTLQLRDDLLKWGIFGGLVNDGEDPKEAVLREVGEELTISLDRDRLDHLRTFVGPRYTTHLFRYRLRRELDTAVLTEGIRFEAKTKSDLRQEDVVAWHWTMLEWYWDRERPA